MWCWPGGEWVDGLMVSRQESGSKGPKWSPRWVTVSCSQGIRPTLKVPLSFQGCKWHWTMCEGNLTIAQGHLQWTSISSRVRSETPGHFMSQRLELSTRADYPSNFSNPLGMELASIPCNQWKLHWNVPNVQGRIQGGWIGWISTPHFSVKKNSKCHFIWNRK